MVASSAGGDSTHGSSVAKRRFGRKLLSLCRRPLHRRAVRVNRDSGQAAIAIGAA